MNCYNCGACCMEQCSPPGYLLLLQQPDKAYQWPDRDDLDRVGNLPAQALRAISDYLLREDFGTDMPCCWLDPATKRCRWYEYRPSICRDLDVGSEGCRSWRHEFNVDVEALRR